MSLSKLRVQATYEKKTHAQILERREEYCSLCDANSVSGYFVFSEGETWIELQGELSDIEAIQEQLHGDDFFQSIDFDSPQSLPALQVTKIYLYDEDQTPVSS